MPAPNILAAERINADRAGLTTEAHFDPTFAAPTASEAIAATFHDSMGALSEMLSGGPHPEQPLPVPTVNRVEKATDSVAGRLGGLVPKATGALAPGPAGFAATARARAAEAIKRLGL